MSAPRPITIVGGGLAGLTLGIALRHRGLPVTIWEAGLYPHHRVCGEFICGRGRGILTELGLDRVLTEAGAREAKTASFFFGKTSSSIRPLPETALCLSRFILDATLANQFRVLGGELHEGKRWTNSIHQDGVVQATGRRAQTQPDGWRWFGLKAHVRNVELAADLELHVAAGGYIGLCRLSGGVVNVCGLFRRGNQTATLAPREEILRGAPGTLLHARLANAEFVSGSTCAVGGLDLRPSLTPGTSECRIGDALTMIAPFTGNGMSMAIEAAALAAEPLEQWSRGSASWAGARASIASGCADAFRQRLSWSDRLHSLMFIAPLQPLLARWLIRSTPAWNFLFRRTR